MKKLSLLLVTAALLACNVSFAQDKEKTEEEGYIFKVTKELKVTPVKDQNRAGTCWCYSGLGFLESELLRMGKGEYDLSEMYIVAKTYNDRAQAAVRMHGDVSFSQGGSFYDVIYGMKAFGLVPESEMRPGAAYGDTLSDHGELSDVTNAIVDAIAKKEHKKLQTDANGNPLWLKSIEAVHEVYLGKCPTEFSYKGVTYTPQSFYNSLGLNPDDYISITSYTHHPFYEKFVLEIQDNWRWGQSYNLPLDEMMQVFDYAIDNGYTVAWGADVSEPGFRSNSRSGFCVLPDLEAKAQIGSDMAHWTGLTVSERNKESQSKPTPQRWVTQEERQIAYDNWETTDDHGMLIYGKATDQIGNEYYMVKNSWGIYGKYDGMFYVSKAYARYKTMNILVHKDGIPKDIKKKLGIK